jgi:hypothetical protein
MVNLEPWRPQFGVTEAHLGMVKAQSESGFILKW